jgi:hypothetical protein
MSREHKYRAWDTNKKVMIYDGDLYHPHRLTKDELKISVYPCKVTSHGILFTRKVPKQYENDYVELTKNGVHQTYYSSWEYEQLSSVNIELMQYIGIKDKNDKEIYESDIIRCNNKNYEVIYEKYQFKLKEFFCSYYDVADDAFVEGILEIIGNKFENPEL